MAAVIAQDDAGTGSCLKRMERDENRADEAPLAVNNARVRLPGGSDPLVLHPRVSFGPVGSSLCEQAFPKMCEVAIGKHRLPANHALVPLVAQADVDVYLVYPGHYYECLSGQAL